MLLINFSVSKWNHWLCHTAIMLLKSSSWTPFSSFSSASPVLWWIQTVEALAMLFFNSSTLKRSEIPMPQSKCPPCKSMHLKPLFNDPCRMKPQQHPSSILMGCHCRLQVERVGGLRNLLDRCHFYSPPWRSRMVRMRPLTTPSCELTNANLPAVCVPWRTKELQWSFNRW